MQIQHELLIGVYASLLCLLSHHDFSQLQQLVYWQGRGSAFCCCLCLKGNGNNSPPDIPLIRSSSQFVQLECYLSLTSKVKVPAYGCRLSELMASLLCVADNDVVCQAPTQFDCMSSKADHGCF